MTETARGQGPPELLYASATARRAVTVPAVAATAGVLASTAWMWGPASLAVDLLTEPRRLPRLRALSIAAGWSALETTGLAMSMLQWVTGRSGAPDPSYQLQRWWVGRLLERRHLSRGDRRHRCSARPGAATHRGA